MERKIYEGLPTMSLFPMNPTRFMVVDEIKLTIPRRGNYNELNPEVFDVSSGDFDLLKDSVLFMPAITRILLATNKYPDLAGNQVFTPSVFVFNEDTVEIQGSILEIIEVANKE